ncbi:PhzF family phenazine biosynthesis protein [Hyphobacterium sp. CCMP332]|jgi:PhzF family phenazine biosynthesis protein|uniref:PhzF family phenazine biosynthesis protein n=1 Tax=Hyphobacterium sp. CCMP332 TaxID=2749086 RepID=UPI0016502A31|nr:PhzF family phenazine biosynthesis protein [Hyphobacterium sp. CCMP332]QNL17967.1 PhzF family phenazine biosynthesis protein [Hyphobacterium sp. CCMP332]
MTQIPYAEIHAFPDGTAPFTGNPAGVCLLDEFPGDDVLLGIAASNNLSETAFLVDQGGDNWQLRWFTPTVEVALCGHATFASGAYLFEKSMVLGDTAVFATRSGDLTVSRTSADRFAMDLPIVPYSPAIPDAVVIEALGAGEPVETVNVNRVHGANYQMMMFADESTIANMRPDQGLLKSAFTNVIVTAPGQNVDFVSRFFAPASGVDEDPVTGSAHCTLAPYWSEKLGRPRLSARQIGPRPGALEVEPVGGRVILTGRATCYLEGEIRL